MRVFKVEFTAGLLSPKWLSVVLRNITRLVQAQLRVTGLYWKEYRLWFELRILEVDLQDSLRCFARDF
jgi:hypothetical protein